MIRSHLNGEIASIIESAWTFIRQSPYNRAFPHNLVSYKLYSYCNATAVIQYRPCTICVRLYLSDLVIRRFSIFVTAHAGSATLGLANHRLSKEQIIPCIITYRLGIVHNIYLVCARVIFWLSSQRYNNFLIEVVICLTDG